MQHRKADAGETSPAARRAVDYFRRPAYRRMLQAVWRKYESLGRIGGKAQIKQVSAEEAEAINAFFGWYVKAGETVSIPLALFEEELRLSAFGIGLAELHRLLEGKPLLSRNEQRVLQDEAWRDLLGTVRRGADLASVPFIAEWLTGLEEGAAPGLRTLRELYHADPESAQAALMIVVRALLRLFGNGRRGAVPAVRLPVLAAKISGDAHALDGNQPAGRLLLAVLREQTTDRSDDPGLPEEELSVEAEDGSATLRIRETYRSVGILDDDLSSIVHGYVPQPGRPPLPEVWTLRQVEAAERLPVCSRIFIAENPAIFSTILDTLDMPAEKAAAPPALLCTSGPASAAAIRWIQRCLEVSGDACQLFYSGDFDLRGLSMGQALANLFPERFRPWCFDRETYLAAVAQHPGPALRDAELARLKEMTVSWDPTLCAAMHETGRKVHQEAFVEKLAETYRNFLRSLCNRHKR